MTVLTHPDDLPVIGRSFRGLELHNTRVRKARLTEPLGTVSLGEAELAVVANGPVGDALRRVPGGTERRAVFGDESVSNELWHNPV